MKKTLNHVIEKPLLVLAGFIILVLLIYFPVLKGDFLHMDDIEGVLNNQEVINLDEAFKTHYIKNIVNSWLYKGFNSNPVPYHLLSLTLHVINSFLVYLLAGYLISKKTAWLAGLVFLIHPANSEAVSWISGSVYLYQALFWLLIIIFFINYCIKKRLIYLLISYIVYILYFLLVGKVWGLVIPFVILALYLFWFKESSRKKYLIGVGIFFVIALFYILLGFRSDYEFRNQDLEYYYVGLEAENRVVSILRAIDRSAKMYVAPYKLDILFGGFDRSAVQYLGILFTSCLVAYLSYYLFTKDRKLFSLFLLVYISALPIFTPINIGLGFAERYFYFSTVFFSLFFIYLFFEQRIFKIKKEVLVPIIILLIMLFSLRTFIRTFDWRSDESIWRSSLKADMKNNYKAYNELGNVYYRQDDLRQALMNYEKALQIRPLYPEVLHNVGLTFIKAGQLESAKLYFQKSLQINPKLYESYYRLGQIANYENDRTLATQYFMASLQIKPDYAPAVEELNKIPVN